MQLRALIELSGYCQTRKHFSLITSSKVFLRYSVPQMRDRISLKKFSYMAIGEKYFASFGARMIF